jgi:N-acetylmuramoyl-L-alanine amidase
MSNRFLIIYSCLLILGGCINEEPMPRIVYSPQSEPKIIQPKIPKTNQTTTLGITEDWLPPSYLEKRWTAIVIHHSGTANGNVAIFDEWHKRGKHWEGVGYDFVIGNGTDSGDGEVEVTFRWRRQQTGAHCKTPSNWANEEAIGICLVGNFNETVPTTRQMQSLVKLVGFLQNRYGIPQSHIYGHKDTPGARATDCPGRNFPMARLKSMLGS